MSLVVLTAGKGAPGVTTAAVALGAVWPREVLVVEADPAGADLAYRYRDAAGGRLAQSRGIVSWATALRDASVAAGQGPLEHAQVLNGGLWVLVGAASRPQVASIGWAWPALADRLAHQDRDVLVDIGRWSPTAEGPSAELVARADLLVVLTRANVEGVAHAGHTLAALDSWAGPVGRRPQQVCAAVVGAGAGAMAEVAAALCTLGTAVAVAGWLAADPAGAEGLRGEWTRRLDCSPLVRSARTLASALDGRLARAVPATVTAERVADLRAPAASPVASAVGD